MFQTERGRKMFINFNNIMVNLDHVISIKKYEDTSILLDYNRTFYNYDTLNFNTTEERDAAFSRIGWAIDNRYLAIDLTSIKTKE